MAHHTKNKGDLGVAMVIADLAKHDILCCAPLSEHLAFDLVAVSPDQEKLCRLQVKYRTAKNSVIQIPLRNSWADRNGTHMQRVDRSKFDAFAVFCPDTEQVYYLRNDEIPDNNIARVALRLKPTANNQIKGVRMAMDYCGCSRLFA